MLINQLKMNANTRTHMNPTLFVLLGEEFLTASQSAIINVLNLIR